MSLPLALQRLRESPGMFLTNPNSESIGAFIAGFDASTGGSFLIGFREWLIVRLDSGNNLAWEALVEMLAGNPGGADSSDERVTGMMFDLLEMFLSERASRFGMRRIYRRYEDWLRRQPWYSETSLSWLE